MILAAATVSDGQDEGHRQGIRPVGVGGHHHGGTAHHQRHDGTDESLPARTWHTSYTRDHHGHRDQGDEQPVTV